MMIPTKQELSVKEIVCSEYQKINKSIIDDVYKSNEDKNVIYVYGPKDIGKSIIVEKLSEQLCNIPVALLNNDGQKESEQLRTIINRLQERKKLTNTALNNSNSLKLPNTNRFYNLSNSILKKSSLIKFIKGVSGVLPIIATIFTLLMVYYPNILSDIDFSMIQNYLPDIILDLLNIMEGKLADLDSIDKADKVGKIFVVFTSILLTFFVWLILIVRWTKNLLKIILINKCLPRCIKLKYSQVKAVENSIKSHNLITFHCLYEDIKKFNQKKNHKIVIIINGYNKEHLRWVNEFIKICNNITFILVSDTNPNIESPITVDSDLYNKNISSSQVISQIEIKKLSTKVADTILSGWGIDNSIVKKQIIAHSTSPINMALGVYQYFKARKRGELKIKNIGGLENFLNDLMINDGNTYYELQKLSITTVLNDQISKYPMVRYKNFPFISSCLDNQKTISSIFDSTYKINPRVRKSLILRFKNESPIKYSIEHGRLFKKYSTHYPKGSTVDLLAYHIQGYNPEVEEWLKSELFIRQLYPISQLLYIPVEKLIAKGDYYSALKIIEIVFKYEELLPRIKENDKKVSFQLLKWHELGINVLTSSWEGKDLKLAIKYLTKAKNIIKEQKLNENKNLIKTVHYDLLLATALSNDHVNYRDYTERKLTLSFISYGISNAKKTLTKLNELQLSHEIMKVSIMLAQLHLLYAKGAFDKEEKLEHNACAIKCLTSKLNINVNNYPIIKDLSIHEKQVLANTYLRYNQTLIKFKLINDNKSVIEDLIWTKDLFKNILQSDKSDMKFLIDYGRCILELVKSISLQTSKSEDSFYLLYEVILDMEDYIKEYPNNNSLNLHRYIVEYSGYWHKLNADENTNMKERQEILNILIVSSKYLISVLHNGVMKSDESRIIRDISIATKNSPEFYEYLNSIQDDFYSKTIINKTNIYKLKKHSSVTSTTRSQTVLNKIDEIKELLSNNKADKAHRLAFEAAAISELEVSDEARLLSRQIYVERLVSRMVCRNTSGYSNYRLSADDKTSIERLCLAKPNKSFIQSILPFLKQFNQNKFNSGQLLIAKGFDADIDGVIMKTNKKILIPNMERIGKNSKRFEFLPHSLSSKWVKFYKNNYYNKDNIVKGKYENEKMDFIDEIKQTYYIVNIMGDFRRDYKSITGKNFKRFYAAAGSMRGIPYIQRTFFNFFYPITVNSSNSPLKIWNGGSQSRFVVKGNGNIINQLLAGNGVLFHQLRDVFGVSLISLLRVSNSTNYQNKIIFEAKDFIANNFRIASIMPKYGEQFKNADLNFDIDDSAGKKVIAWVSFEGLRERSLETIETLFEKVFKEYNLTLEFRSIEERYKIE